MDNGLFDMSCWCETSVLLTFMDLIQNDTFLIITADHESGGPGLQQGE